MQDRTGGLLISRRASLDEDSARQCRWFSVVLLVIIGVGTVVSIAYLYETRAYIRETALDHAVSFGAVGLLVGCYLLNRAGHFRLAASLTIISATVAIFISAVPSPGIAELSMLNYLPIPIVLSGLVLSVPFTIGVATASVIGVVLMPVLVDVGTATLPLSSTVLVGVFVVVAARQREQVEAARRSRIEELASHDALTGLPNRLLFAEHLQSAVARAQREGSAFAVLFVDIDNFKSINDALGHAGGDALLSLVAARLAASVRASDVVSRQGGDEFCVLIDRLDAPELSGAVIRKLLSDLRRPFALRGQEIFVTASFGASVCPDDGIDHDELIRKADTALYTAKERGKDTFSFYSRAMSEAAATRLELAAEIQHAIERGEIDVVYQPQIDSGTGSVIGVECLARWNHSTRGPISPELFIPLAEQSGVIRELTHHVTRTALSRIGSAIRSPFRISLNVSERDLRSRELAQTLREVIEAGQLSPHTLEIELTENIVFRRLDRARPVLEELKALGVRLAVDDFGSGYATLRQLADFPIDTVKIDRSFTRTITEGPQHEAIIAGVMEIASRLGMDHVVEGVETAEQVERLRALGCTVFQGWYYAKAMSAGDLIAIVGRGFAPAEG